MLYNKKILNNKTLHRKRKEKIDRKKIPYVKKKRRKTDILNVYACMLQMNGSMFNGDDDDEFECIGMIRILILVQKESIDQIIIIMMIEKI